MANKPVKEKRFGMLRVAAWDNEKVSKRDGAKFKVRSFTLTKAWPTAGGVFEERRLPINKSDLIDLECAVRYMMDLITRDLEDFGVKFDTWTSQAGLEERKEVEEALEILEKGGYLYEDEGAKWFASTKLGDDKDRVVVKSDGSYTYLAPDIAYHLDKYRRGYSHLVDLLGPDHHGYIGRMKAAVQALGHDAKSLDILIVQLVTLLRQAS